MKGDANRGYQPGRLSETPSDFRKWFSPYDFQPEEIEVLQRRNLSCVWTNTFAVSTAQTPQNPLIINQPGRAFSIKGLTTATVYNPTTNAGIETVATTVFVGCFVYSKYGNNQGMNDISESIFIKNGGGYHGDFLSLGFFWPTQASNSVRITIYRYDGQPWQSGDVST